MLKCYITEVSQNWSVTLLKYYSMKVLQCCSARVLNYYNAEVIPCWSLSTNTELHIHHHHLNGALHHWKCTPFLTDISYLRCETNNNFIKLWNYLLRLWYFSLVTQYPNGLMEDKKLQARVSHSLEKNHSGTYCFLYHDIWINCSVSSLVALLFLCLCV